MRRYATEPEKGHGRIDARRRIEILDQPEPLLNSDRAGVPRVARHS